MFPPRGVAAKWAGIAKPPSSPSRGDGGLGVVRGCSSRIEAKPSWPKARQYLMCQGYGACGYLGSPFLYPEGETEGGIKFHLFQKHATRPWRLPAARWVGSLMRSKS